MKISTRNEFIPINLVGLLLILTITFSPYQPLRVALAVPFMLLFPGYALTVAMFPVKGSLSGPARITLSFGLSIAVVPAIGYILNFSPWGISLGPVLYSVFSFTVITSLIAVRRRAQIPENERFTVDFCLKLPGWEGTRFDKALVIALVVLMLSAVGIFGYFVMNPAPRENFTEFYVLGRYGRTENYPSKFIMEGSKVVAVDYGASLGEVEAESGEVTLQIVNHENRRVTYLIKVEIDGQQVPVGLDGQDQKEIGPIGIEPDGKWEKEVSFRPLHSGYRQNVAFILYKDGAPSYDKSANIWVSAVERGHGL